MVGCSRNRGTDIPVRATGWKTRAPFAAHNAAWSSGRLTLPVLRKSGKLSSHSSVDVSAVHFTAVSDADDDNDKLTVTNRVNNSPVTYADAVEAFHADQLNSIRWSRIVLKRLEFEDNAMPHVAGHVVEYLARPFI